MGGRDLEGYMCLAQGRNKFIEVAKIFAKEHVGTDDRLDKASHIPKTAS